MDDLNFDDNENQETSELLTALDVIQKLEEAWLNEKLAPDLLPHEGELVECLMDQIQHMEKSLQKIPKEDFRLVFHKMELDRIKYVLSSYLRTRLEKIQKFGAHYLHLENTEDCDPNLMSDEERDFAFKFTSSIKNYLSDVALKNFPQNMQSLKMEEVGCKPQLEKSVFIKAKSECQGVVIDDFANYGEEDVVDLTAGSQHVLRYKSVATLLKNGMVKLI